MDDYYGWIWIPDTQWGPAWVNWHYDDYVIGWIPMQPIYSIPGLRISINFRINYNYWNIVSYNRFLDRDVHRYYYTKQRTNSYFKRNYGKHRQIDMRDNFGRDRIERKLRTTIKEVRTTETDRLRDVESRDRNSARTTDRAYKMDITKLRDDYKRDDVKTERTRTERMDKDAETSVRNSRTNEQNSERGTINNRTSGSDNPTRNEGRENIEKRSSDATNNGRTTYERPSSERTGERARTENPRVENKSSENKSTERPTVNRTESSRSSSERPTVDRSSRSRSESPKADRSSRDNGSSQSRRR